MHKIFLALLLAGLPAFAAVAQQEKYAGFDLDKVAEATSRWTSYRSQYGEGPAKGHFESWLAAQGLSRAGYDQAYAAYWERFKVDATGKLEAQFHLAIQKYTQQFEYGDVPDRSQEAHGGVTLDRYAQVSVALSRQPGADVEKVLEDHGIAGGLAGWQKVNAAWAEAFKNDTAAALAMQFGLLYQKYAGPEFQKEQEQKLADSLAGRFDREPAPREPPPERPTAAQLRAALTSPVQSERWEAARPLAWECDRLDLVAEKDRKADPRWAHCQPAVLRQEWLPVVLDIVDHVPEDQLNLATGLLDYVAELGFAKDAKLTYLRCLNRLKPALATLEAAFAPIKDKAVPERFLLRAKIDEHRAAIREIERKSPTGSGRAKWKPMASSARSCVSFFGLALGLLAGLAGAQQEAADKVHGFDLDTLAKATAQATAFSSQYGTAQGHASFDQWLRQQDLSLADYDAAYSAFLERFAKDPTGRLEQSYFAALDLYTPAKSGPTCATRRAPRWRARIAVPRSTRPSPPTPGRRSTPRLRARTRCASSSASAS